MKYLFSLILIANNVLLILTVSKVSMYFIDLYYDFWVMIIFVWALIIFTSTSITLYILKKLLKE